jgi:hypothetical protein
MGHGRKGKAIEIPMALLESAMAAIADTNSVHLENTRKRLEITIEGGPRELVEFLSPAIQEVKTAMEQIEKAKAAQTELWKEVFGPLGYGC